MSAECAFCFLNLKIQGTFKSSVSLFNRTANQDLVSSVQGLNANSFVLCDLLSAIGIKVRQENTLKSSCKKCARKIITCYNTFIQISDALEQRSHPSSPPTAVKGIRKRLSCFSPSGFSPKSKTATVTNANIRKASIRGGSTQTRSRRRLCMQVSNNAEDSENLESEMRNLMNLPIAVGEEKVTQPVVKVCIHSIDCTL